LKLSPHGGFFPAEGLLANHVGDDVELSRLLLWAHFLCVAIPTQGVNPRVLNTILDCHSKVFLGIIIVCVVHREVVDTSFSLEVPVLRV